MMMAYYKVFNETLSKLAVIGLNVGNDAEILAQNPKLADAAKQAEDLIQQVWNILNQAQQTD